MSFIQAKTVFNNFIEKSHFPGPYEILNEEKVGKSDWIFSCLPISTIEANKKGVEIDGGFVKFLISSQNEDVILIRSGLTVGLYFNWLNKKHQNFENFRDFENYYWDKISNNTDVQAQLIYRNSIVKVNRKRIVHIIGGKKNYSVKIQNIRAIGELCYFYDKVEYIDTMGILILEGGEYFYFSLYSNGMYELNSQLEKKVKNFIPSWEPKLELKNSSWGIWYSGIQGNLTGWKNLFKDFEVSFEDSDNPKRILYPNIVGRLSDKTLKNINCT